MAPVNAALIDIHAANVEVRESEKQDASRQAALICGASSVMAFLNAVEYYQDRIAEIERKGRCLQCSGPLVAEHVCVRCGRDNS